MRAASPLGIVLALACGCARSAPQAGNAPSPGAPSTTQPWPTPGWVVVAQAERERCDARSAKLEAGPPAPIGAQPLAGTIHDAPFRVATALAYRLDQGRGWVISLHDAPRACGESEPRTYAGYTVELYVDAWAPAPPRRLNPTHVAVRHPFSIAYRPVQSCEPARAAIEIVDGAEDAARGRVRVRLEWDGGAQIEGEVLATVCPP